MMECVQNLEVIGEALNRLRKADPATAARIGDVSRIVAFRNILVHGYDIVDHTIVGHVIQDRLPSLATTVRQLLAEVGPENPPVA